MREEVAAAQLLLVKLGRFEGPVDGRLGEDTEAALAAWRAEAGIPGEEVDEALLAALLEAAARQRIRVPPVVAALAAENG
jgi:peptidoglycan hydrolase-like protein with peptidoglycan-binding domain